MYQGYPRADYSPLPPPQAREEVIRVLKAEQVDPAQLEAQYGSVKPYKVLQTLWSDALQAKADQGWEDIYEKPVAEVQIPYPTPPPPQNKIHTSMTQAPASRRVCRYPELTNDKVEDNHVCTHNISNHFVFNVAESGIWNCD